MVLPEPNVRHGLHRLLSPGNGSFKMAVMEVQSWSGDWNLPSIDISCLEVLVRKFSSPFSPDSIYF